MHVICFSKDRPLQLDGYLRSLRAAFDCRLEVSVLVAASNEHFGRAYNDLITRCLEEKKFDKIMFSYQSIKAALRQMLLNSQENVVMFGCDDVVFKDKIDNRWEELINDKTLFGFSFRLGKNITYCHPADRHEKFEGTNISGMLIWSWMRSSGVDFAYPFELNATAYRIETVLMYLDMLSGFGDWHPNILEGNFYHPDIMSQFKSQPLMMSYEESKAHVVTVNRVQDVAANRIYGERSAEELLHLYEAGTRLDLDWYRNRTWNSIHIGELQLK